MAGSIAALVGGGAASQAAEKTSTSQPAAQRGNPIAVSTYSFWRFKNGLKMPIETCIDEAARIMRDALERG